MMKDAAEDLNQRIASRVGELRAALGVSLAALAEKSGVSRSMISLIERDESSPTAVVLGKLSSALGVTLGSFFDPPTAAELVSSPVARHEDQPQWRDPESGYRRRNVSPPGAAQPMRIVEVHFPAGARVAFESAERDIRTYQQVWVLEGTMNVTVAKDRHRLNAGDCLAMQLDSPILFHNPGNKVARYVVITASESARPLVR